VEAVVSRRRDEVAVFALWVTVQVLPGKREVFLEAITTAAASALRDEPGCVAFDVLELDPAEQRFALYEKYRDETAWAEEHRSSPHFLAWRAVADQVLVPGSQVNTRATVVAGPADDAVSGGVA
jgi:(4S)-4-hydroxy-5-phosphonooxypentane-2,3-dione isomerase